MVKKIKIHVTIVFFLLSICGCSNSYEMNLLSNNEISLSDANRVIAEIDLIAKKYGMARNYDMEKSARETIEARFRKKPALIRSYEVHAKQFLSNDTTYLTAAYYPDKKIIFNVNDTSRYSSMRLTSSLRKETAHRIEMILENKVFIKKNTIIDPT